MRLLAGLTASVALLLAACGGQEHEDLRQWMKEAAKDLRGNIPPLPKVKPYEPVAYDASDITDPFSTTKAAGIQDRSAANMPDLDRPREPLEEFPLETMQFVGFFQDKNRLVAHVLVNGKSYDVRVGNFVGQNFGKVASIVTEKDEEKIVLQELVQEADGAWVERESTLFIAGGGRK